MYSPFNGISVNTEHCGNDRDDYEYEIIVRLEKNHNLYLTQSYNWIIYPDKNSSVKITELKLKKQSTFL